MCVPTDFHLGEIEGAGSDDPTPRFDCGFKSPGLLFFVSPLLPVRLLLPLFPPGRSFGRAAKNFRDHMEFLSWCRNGGRSRNRMRHSAGGFYWPRCHRQAVMWQSGARVRLYVTSGVIASIFLRSKTEQNGDTNVEKRARRPKRSPKVSL